MSADNYYVIRKDQFGLFAPVMGFASDDITPSIKLKHPRFRTIAAAVNAMKDEYTEYGTSVHPECHEDKIPELEELNGHILPCPKSFDASWYSGIEDEWVCACEQIKTDANTEQNPYLSAEAEKAIIDQLQSKLDQEVTRLQTA